MRCRLLLVALLSLVLVAPGTASGGGPAGGDTVASASAKKKKKKAKRKACKAGQVRKVKKVDGKRKKVCVKKRKKDDGNADITDPAKPDDNTVTPNPTPTPVPTPVPSPTPAPTPPPEDPEKYRADDEIRQAIAGQNIFLERATSGSVTMEYTRIFLWSDGRFKISVIDWNSISGEMCRGNVEGTWSFYRAYKHPEQGVLMILNMTKNGGQPGTETFLLGGGVVRVGKDLVEYQINENMRDQC